VKEGKKKGREGKWEGMKDGRKNRRKLGRAGKGKEMKNGHEGR
jgi:hypothetical protein